MSFISGRHHILVLSLKSCWLVSALCAITLLGVSATSAQQNPFDNPFQKAKPAESAAPPVEQPRPRQEQLDIDSDPPRVSPEVRAIQDSDLRSPQALFKAAGMFMDLDEYELAIEQLEKLQGIQLTDQQLFNLYRNAGPDLVFRIGVDQKLGPLGKSTSTRIVDAAERYSTDQARFQELLTAVVDDDKYKRSDALADLRLLGADGAAALIERLADESQRNNWPRIRAALGYFANSAEGPLLAALYSKNRKLSIEAIRALASVTTPGSVEALIGYLAASSDPLARQVARRSIKKLSGRLPSQSEVESRLFRSAHQYLMDQVILSQDPRDSVKWWHWDETTNSLVASWMTAKTVARIRGFRRANDLLQLDPASIHYQQIYWLTRFESAKLSAGIKLPLPGAVLEEFAASIDDDLLVHVLEQALRHHRIPAAIAACEVAGKKARPEYLFTRHDQASPLIQSLNVGSIRLTHAACEAIFQIDPNQSFSGSSRYLASLVYLSRSGGRPKALVGHVDTQTAITLAAMVSKTGFSADTANSSRQFFELATNDPDYELLVLTDSLSRPEIAELIQALRAHPRTRRQPIVLLAQTDKLRRATRIAGRFEYVYSGELVLNESLVARQIDNALATLDYEPATNTERLSFSDTALQHLAHFAENPARYAFFDLTNQQELLLYSLNTPGNAAKTCQLLARIATPQAQRNLVQLASNSEMPTALRQTAALSLAKAVQTRGLMLTRQEILAQYKRYNASASESQQSQKLLGYVLDIIERRVK